MGRSDKGHGRSPRWRRLTEQWATPADQWRTNVQHWVDAGIVTPAQGDQILSTQGVEAPSESDAGELSRSQELLSYVVLALTALGAVLYLGHYWARLGLGGHLSVALIVSVDSLVVGASIVELRGGGARRLGGLLWLIATVGVATSVSDVLGTGPHLHGLRNLIVGLALVLTSAFLWRNQHRPLQFLSAVVGFVLAMSGLATTAGVTMSSTQLALVLWLCSFAVGLGSLQLLRPAITALVVGFLGCGVAALSLSFSHHLMGVVLGVVTALGVALLGVVLARPLVIVLGGLGFFMFDIRAFSLYLRSSDAAVGAGLLGLLIVSVALWHATQTFARERRSRAQSPSEVDGELIAT